MFKQKAKYALTVNAKNKTDMDNIVNIMNRSSAASSRLTLDQCFGPCSSDGSYLLLYSSDAKSIDGYVDEWARNEANKFFKKLAKMIPAAKFTFKFADKSEPEVNSQQIYGRRPEYCVKP